MHITEEILTRLAHGLPPIVMLSYYDQTGGAAKAAMVLFETLLASGADVKMLVAKKSSKHDNVIDVSPERRKKTVLKTALHQAEFGAYLNIPSGFEGFNGARSLALLEGNEFLQKAGIVHWHWVANLVGFQQHNSLFRGKTIVWTLHDMNPFTGGCHYTAGCEKWKTNGCAACPQLGSPSGTVDLAARIFASKQAGYSQLDLNIVALSGWMGQNAGDSLLLGAANQYMIPNGIDLRAFHPVEQKEARNLLDLPSKAKILCFGGDGWQQRLNKGFYFLMEALRQLAATEGQEPPFLLTFGNNSAHEHLPKAFKHHSLGYLDDAASLRLAYSAADVFIQPSIQDNLPTTLIEAQACGTPGIGFYGTGAADIIEDGVTGFLAQHPGMPLKQDGSFHRCQPFMAEAKDVVDLAFKVQTLFALPQARYTQMREACRVSAVNQFSVSLQAARYLMLYRHLAGLPKIDPPVNRI